jgi:hypothetical protein
MASNVVAASHRDFQLKGDGNIRIMTVNSAGISLVFFKSQKCQAIQSVILSIARSFPNVNFVIADIDSYPQIVVMSRSTNAAIQAAPALIVYYNGIPQARFRGSSYDAGSISKFVYQMLSQIQSRTASVPVSSSKPYYGGLETSHSQAQHVMKGKEPASSPYKPTGMGFQEMGDEKDDRLEMPSDIIPYNLPWESSYRDRI